jgi:hypothetical protein
MNMEGPLLGSSSCHRPCHNLDSKHGVQPASGAARCLAWLQPYSHTDVCKTSQPHILLPGIGFQATPPGAATHVEDSHFCFCNKQNTCQPSASP